jgi:hypothetical protein
MTCVGADTVSVADYVREGRDVDIVDIGASRQLPT